MRAVKQEKQSFPAFAFFRFYIVIRPQRVFIVKKLGRPEAVFPEMVLSRHKSLSHRLPVYKIGALINFKRAAAGSPGRIEIPRPRPLVHINSGRVAQRHVVIVAIEQLCIVIARSFAFSITVMRQFCFFVCVAVAADKTACCDKHQTKQT